MEKNIKELINPVAFINSQFDIFNNKTDSVISELKKFKLENEKIKSENLR